MLHGTPRKISRARTAVVPNGVDLSYFCPHFPVEAPRPNQCVFVGVLDYRPNSASGQTWKDPDNCAAHIASFLVTGSRTEQVEARLEQLDSWFLKQVEWEENPLAGSA